MNTKRLVRDLSTLRNDFASHGPTEKLVVVRQLLNQIRRLYNLQARYEAYKAKHPIRIEFLECNRKLTRTDLLNLQEAKVVNKQITDVIRSWKSGRMSEVTS